jgi:competence protein ComEC
VLGLLLVDPWLAVTVGFALSVLATAGSCCWRPAWRDALARWMPPWLAEAIAVPAAAQLACTPVVAAISGQVSLVAVLANLLAGPLVAPATVLGLIGGLLGWSGTRSGRARHPRRLVRGLDHRGRGTRRRAADAGDRLGHRTDRAGRC